MTATLPAAALVLSPEGSSGQSGGGGASRIGTVDKGHVVSPSPDGVWPSSRLAATAGSAPPEHRPSVANGLRGRPLGPQRACGGRVGAKRGESRRTRGRLRKGRDLAPARLEALRE